MNIAGHRRQVSKSNHITLMQKRNIYYVVLIVLAFSNLVIAKEPGWLTRVKNIKIFKTTKDDVIRVFGITSPMSNEHHQIFELEEGQLVVDYSFGDCKSNIRNEWDVAEFVVTAFAFTPSKAVDLDDLGLESMSFKKFPVYDVPGAYYCENIEMGISYGLNRKGKVEILEFYPPAADNYLFCKRKRESK
jgi:hypothetical protein